MLNARYELLLALGASQLVCLAAVLGMDLPAAWWAGAALTCAALVVLLWWRWPEPGQSLGPANRVTLLRALPVTLLAGVVFAPDLLPEHGLAIFSLAACALVLDGVDGWVARRYGVCSDFGARFDMELDAFFILLLCVLLWLADRAPIWVLMIGLMRYLFLAAMWRWGWLAGRLPDSERRKRVCVWQVVCLMASLLPWWATHWVQAALASALILLAWSFVVDIRWLYRHRTDTQPPLGYA